MKPSQIALVVALAASLVAPFFAYPVFLMTALCFALAALHARLAVACRGGSSSDWALNERHAV